MYKGYKVDVFAEYEFIMQQPKCMQMFLYDMISDQFTHHGGYSVVKAVNGDLYVRKLNNNEIVCKYIKKYE